MVTMDKLGSHAEMEILVIMLVQRIYRRNCGGTEMVPHTCQKDIQYNQRHNHMAASNMSISQVQILCFQYLRAGDIIILDNVLLPTDINTRKCPKDGGFPISIVTECGKNLTLFRFC